VREADRAGHREGPSTSARLDLIQEEKKFRHRKHEKKEKKRTTLWHGKNSIRHDEKMREEAESCFINNRIDLRGVHKSVFSVSKRKKGGHICGRLDKAKRGGVLLVQKNEKT